MLFYFACEAAGASSARHSLRPLIAAGLIHMKNSRDERRDREAVSSACCRLERTRAMPTISGMPVVNPVLQSQHSFRAHRLDREITRQRGGAAEGIDGAVTLCCARNPGHPCAAFASVALQRLRNRRAAVVWG